MQLLDFPAGDLPSHKILDKICFSSRIKRWIPVNLSNLSLELILVHSKDILPPGLEHLITLVKCLLKLKAYRQNSQIFKGETA